MYRPTTTFFHRPSSSSWGTFCLPIAAQVYSYIPECWVYFWTTTLRIDSFASLSTISITKGVAIRKVVPNFQIAFITLSPKHPPHPPAQAVRFRFSLSRLSSAGTTLAKG